MYIPEFSWSGFALVNKRFLNIISWVKLWGFLSWSGSSSLLLMFRECTTILSLDGP
ncbi:hypothetical protein HanXRQr2_Chr11g0498631 [Helianthus annuus]|uniref:Uncharacterized protein n=1 Tax=Helianthus annuus TaxID=4232 RepID=A0A9K3N0N7_HELAN|nr:hypothetical protein HanXRQr2_Chr11g0498631 [Helianthus annuus]KAJ0875776.1 hypothetical protein HanPSC8_Chr11g0480481 [Helianthus annuus]